MNFSRRSRSLCLILAERLGFAVSACWATAGGETTANVIATATMPMRFLIACPSLRSKTVPPPGQRAWSFPGCVGGGSPQGDGCFRVPAIVVALARLCRAFEALLHRGLAKRFVVLQIDDGLVADESEVAVVAGERLDAGAAGQHLAADREVDILDAVHEFGPPLLVFLFELGGQGRFGRIGLLRAGRGQYRRQRHRDGHNRDDLFYYVLPVA